MTEQETDLQDPLVLRRAAEHLTDRYAGVFFPELVERCVAECHADLARQARIPTYLAPMALHSAADGVIVFGTHQLGPMGGGTLHQSWPAVPVIDTDRGPGVAAELETQVQALWLEITAGTAADPGSERA